MNLSHRFRQRLLLGVSVLCGAGLMFGVSSASAMPVEYVKVCSLYGANFAYSPGTDNCMDTAPLEYRKQTEFGTMSNYIQHGGGSLVYGTNGYATGTDSSAFGDGAFAGGNPNGDIIVPPPVTRDPSSPDYDSSYIDFYDTETNHGVVNRALFPASRYPYSSFFNAGATAIGQGAQAGASGAGEANATAVGQGALANAKNATTVGQGSSADAQGATALGQGSSAGAQKATAVGQGAVASAASSVAIGQGSAATQANTVSFGAPGAERRLVNVAAGVMGTDAVNVDQLNAAVLSVAAQQGDAVGGNSQGLAGPSASGDGAYAGGQGASASGQDSLAVGNGANASGPGAVALGAGAQATGDPTTAVGNMAVASGNNSSAFGGGATASGVNSLALGQGSTASALGGTAIGQGASVTAANSVALGAGSIASRGAQSGYT
ncbi:MAG TPA: porin, partial [Caulobacteraceae bacterium]